jgi:hypothetical protein
MTVAFSFPLDRSSNVPAVLLFKQKAPWLLYGAFMLRVPPNGYGHGLPFIYGMWIFIVLLMYPLCWVFLRLKQRRLDWWWLHYL